jgi:hypothetical protein
VAVIPINLNDPVQNKQFTDMGGAEKYALTISTFKDPKTGQTLRGAGGAGSVAIPWINTGSFDALPDFVKDQIMPAWRKVLTGEAVMGYNPFEKTVGYAINPETGQIILKQPGGGASYPSAYLKSDGAGGYTGSSAPSDDGTGSSSLDTIFGGVTAGSGTAVDPAKMARQSAYDFLREQFAQYGLESLVTEIQGLVESNVAPSEFAIRLRQTPTYKQRFAGNDARIKAGLRALSEGEYIGLEDQYQNILRNYGLPKSYYEKDNIGRQVGFEKFIAGDVSPAELEDRLQLGINRVKNAAPEVEQTLRQFYPGITQGDILAYTLDPERALTDIQRKVQAAEIGAEARRAGLEQSRTYAEELQRYGVTKESAQQGFQAISEFLPRARQLGDIYAKQGMGPYTQTTAEQEVFSLPGAAEAGRQRRKLAELETAQFSGQTGVGALARERAGQF